MCAELRWWFVMVIWALWNMGRHGEAYTVALWADLLMREDASTSNTIRYK